MSDTSSRHAERWLASIVESSDDAIIGEDLDGIITNWNAGAERIFGYTAAEAIGRPVTMLAWPGEEAIIDAYLVRLRRGERVDHFEVLRRHKDGRKLTISLSLSPIRDDAGRIAGIAKIGRDLTQQLADRERLHAQQQQVEQLTEREATARAEAHFAQRFRELTESAPGAILQVDSTGRIVIANPPAEAMFGYARGAMLHLGVDQLIPEAARARHALHRRDFIAAGRTRPMGEGLDLQAQRRNGSTFPVEISLSPVEAAGATFVTAVIRDVTQRRQDEKRLRELQESYMAELRDRQVEAERLNHLKSEFMASISHELRTPLHTILGFAELLEEESHTLNERQQRFLTHIRKDADHLLGLINDVLDLSRIEAGGLVLHPELFSLDSALSEAVESIRPAAASRTVTVGLLPAADIVVHADRLRLRQILNNLLSNAVKFTPAGGAVTVSAQDLGAFVEVCVADTGIGIAPAECDKIFAKFYQSGNTLKGVREGTGLGLAITRQLVEMQGGTIHVESEPGKGSRFCFTLPTLA